MPTLNQVANQRVETLSDRVLDGEATLSSGLVLNHLDLDFRQTRIPRPMAITREKKLVLGGIHGGLPYLFCPCVWA